MAAMASAMDVIFHVDCSSTEPGEQVFIVASCKELGAWDPAEALPCFTSSATFPRWTSTAVKLPIGSRTEFKVLIRGHRGNRWEHGQNRQLQVELPVGVEATKMVSLTYGQQGVKDAEDAAESEPPTLPMLLGQPIKAAVPCDLGSKAALPSEGNLEAAGACGSAAKEAPAPQEGRFQLLPKMGSVIMACGPNGEEPAIKAAGRLCAVEPAWPGGQGHGSAVVRVVAFCGVYFLNASAEAKRCLQQFVSKTFICGSAEDGSRGPRVARLFHARLARPGTFQMTTPEATAAAGPRPGEVLAFLSAIGFARLQDDLLGKLIACVQKQWQQLRHQAELTSDRGSSKRSHEDLEDIKPPAKQQRHPRSIFMRCSAGAMPGIPSPVKKDFVSQLRDDHPEDAEDLGEALQVLRQQKINSLERLAKLTDGQWQRLNIPLGIESLLKEEAEAALASSTGEESAPLASEASAKTAPERLERLVDEVQLEEELVSESGLYRRGAGRVKMEASRESDGRRSAQRAEPGMLGDMELTPPHNLPELWRELLEDTLPPDKRELLQASWDRAASDSERYMLFLEYSSYLRKQEVSEEDKAETRKQLEPLLKQYGLHEAQESDSPGSAIWFMLVALVMVIAAVIWYSYAHAETEIEAQSL
ncbi:cgt [Symbiodinium natans]|uniref:Cgt protein n=1 Tax=Symbiodinium natans TaxID=878477 RepID=A0A812KID6_9DINO|nr:cgt [Symbiodinium natans]